MTCCPRFGNGMADFVPAIGFGAKYRCNWAEFSPERSNLIKLCSDLTEDLI